MGDRVPGEPGDRVGYLLGLTRFKCPVRIDFGPELPRNAIGKIQKQVLRSCYVTRANAS
jgi:non-ribosomal peptide synthetase component E (peptide arylation enzyme)